MKKIITFLTLLISLQYTVGQELITDFTDTGDKGSSPLAFIEFNEKLFFEATTEDFGREIWITNGNKNEAYLLKDINPGKNSGLQGKLNTSSIILNNTLYFIANDGNSNGELWKTDGSEEGTERVTNFLNSNITKLTLVGNKFYFLIQNNYSLQVWVSDGSTVGTKIVLDNIPIWNTPSFEGKCNNTFIFTFQAYGSNYSKVWRSDGTSSGTFPITNSIDGNGASQGTSALSHYIEFNNELYFVSRYFLHKTDGTLQNTVNITALHNASTRLINYGDAIAANGKLYFSFFEADYNRLFIWESNGTALGSKIIYDKTGAKYFKTSNLLAKDNSLLFCSINNTGGTSLTTLNLTNYSVNFIKEIENNTRKPFIFITTSDICLLQHISYNRIFCSTRINNKFEGWVSGLTEETTSNIPSLSLRTIFNFKNSLYFSKNSTLEGNELWNSDGTENNTLLYDNINKNKYGLINTPLISLNSSIVFKADNGKTANEIWKYDAGSLTLLKGASSSNNGTLVKVGNDIFFTSNDTEHGSELWKTNGTETKIVHDIVEGTMSSYPSLLTPHKGNLYFVVQKDNQTYLCKTDGSNLKLITSLGFNEYGVPFTVKEIRSSGDYLYFVTDAEGGDLWISDGTTTGTYKLKDFYLCKNLTDVNGKLFFSAYETYLGEEELWSTEGTESSTKLSKNIGIGYSSQPQELINFNGLLYFTALTNENGREIWKSDGTENGTQQLIDINIGKESSIKNAGFCIAGNTLFFSANDGKNGCELWKTNGVESGTTLVKDINTGVPDSFPNEFVSSNNLIYFQAYDAVNGAELWKSDGTESGTVMVANIISGNIGSSPSNILPINNDLFFIAGSIEKGRQVWKIPYNNLSSETKYLYDQKITVYPNPSIDFIYFNTDLELKNIFIYSENGSLMTVKNREHNKIDISNFPTGLYIVNFDVNGKSISRKIIKK